MTQTPRQTQVEVGQVAEGARPLLGGASGHTEVTELKIETTTSEKQAA